MDNAVLREDYDFLCRALMKHPSILVDAQTRKDFMELCQSKIEGISTYEDLIDAATELTVFFRDGHTNIEVPYSPVDFCVPLRCGWDGRGGLALREEYGGIPAGAYILGIQGITVENLISLMSQRIPHENSHLVRSRMLAYPYQNYHVFSETSLRYLFGAQKEYDVTFMVDGESMVKPCRLEKYSGFLDFADDSDFIGYEIEGNKAILHLNACIMNEKYKSTLENLAQLCQERQIKSLILDLSRNMGGNSAVIDEFITYTNAESFRRYEMIDYSSGEPMQITSRREIVRNKRKPICFPPHILCRVSCHTFSSARTFAVTLKDNGIARVIGTETGGKPNSYGMPRKFAMPASKLRFRVSTSYFMRPDASKDDALTLAIDAIHPKPVCRAAECEEKCT
nr:S41 family peptidase [uncultured Acetatifactor sp.]